MVVPLSKVKLIKLLQPRFSEEGSNQRQQENSVYRTFLEYFKEVTVSVCALTTKHDFLGLKYNADESEQSCS